MALKISSLPRHIAISGAGPVGSLLALSLAQRGHTVDVYERRGDMRKTGEDAGRSINLALSDRGWNALDAAGVGDKLRKRSIGMTGRMVHLKDGKENLQPYSQTGRGIFAVHRTELNKSLVTYAEEHEGVTFHFGCKTLSVDVYADSNKKPTLHLEKSGVAFSVQADAVLGADGAGSAIRTSMMQQMPRFNYSIDWLEHGYKEVYIPPCDGKGDARFRLEKNALHIWPRGEFMLIGLPNLDGSFTGTLFMPFASDKGPSFASLQNDDDIRAFFEAEFSDVVAHLGDTVSNFRNHPTSSLGTVRCGPWNVKGKVCLFGDAAHAVVPFYGQGLVAGFEDVDEFTKYIDAEEDWTQAFEAFALERKPNADAIADLALANFLEMRDHVADETYLLRKKIEKRAAELFPERFMPFYTMVTFTHMPYAQAQRWGNAQNIFLNQLLEDNECRRHFLDEDYEIILKKKIESFLNARESAEKS